MAGFVVVMENVPMALHALGFSALPCRVFRNSISVSCGTHSNMMKRHRNRMQLPARALTTHPHNCYCGRRHPHSQTKSVKTSGENDECEKQKRQIGGTKTMESLNKSIEIVEQNRWNRWTNPMDSFTKTGAFTG